MKTADCKTLISKHLAAEFGMTSEEVPLKGIKRLRKVKDNRGRTVRSFTVSRKGGSSEQAVVFITDETDSKMVDIIVSYDIDPEDTEMLKDSLTPWDWEFRMGGRPQGWDNAPAPSLFYFCFCPPYEPGDEPYVVVTRKDLWDTEGYVDDSEISDLVTEPYPLERLMESMYEYKGTEADTRTLLLNAGFIENTDIAAIVADMG